MCGEDCGRRLGRRRPPAPRATTPARVGALMDLLEYQGKQLFARRGVPVPEGTPATTVEEAVAAADELGYPCVVKAQVLIGGRGKAGGIKLANDRKEAEEHARAILGMDIRGVTLHPLWGGQASGNAPGDYASVLVARPAPRPP